MKYTVRQEPWVDQQIKAQLDRICGYVREELGDNLVALILAGSFGRGEGSVLILNDQTIMPLKDFDLKAVVKRKVSFEQWKEMNASLYQLLKISDPTTGIYHFSTFNLTLDQIIADTKKLRPDISNYDLTHSGQVLFGEDYLMNWRVNLYEVPLTSGLRLLFKKMSGLILVAKYSDLLCPSSEQIRRNIVYECNKTFVEIGSSLCLLGGIYVPYYRARADLLFNNYRKSFPELADRMPDLANRVAQATGKKLLPDELFNNDIDVFKLWHEAAYALMEVLRFYTPKAVGGQSAETWEAFAIQAYAAMGKHYYIPLVKYLLEKYTFLSSSVLVKIVHPLFNRFVALRHYRQSLQKECGRDVRLWPFLVSYSPIIRLFTVAPLIVSSVREEPQTFDNTKLLLALKHLNGIYPVKIDDWQLRDESLHDRIRIIYANVFNSYHFAK